MTTVTTQDLFDKQSLLEVREKWINSEQGMNLINLLKRSPSQKDIRLCLEVAYITGILVLKENYEKTRGVLHE